MRGRRRPASHNRFGRKLIAVLRRLFSTSEQRTGRADISHIRKEQTRLAALGNVTLARVAQQEERQIREHVTFLIASSPNVLDGRVHFQGSTAPDVDMNSEETLNHLFEPLSHVTVLPPEGISETRTGNLH